MHFSKILGATALFHFTLFATVSHGHYLNQAANQDALGRRVDVVIPKGGDDGKGGKGGSSGDTNSGKPAGANPDAGNPNTGQDAGSPYSQGSTSSRVEATAQIAKDDKDTGMDKIETDDEYKARGVLALQKNQDAIKAKVDKAYDSMDTSYRATFDSNSQPIDSILDIDTIMKVSKLQQESDDGWSFVEVFSKTQSDPTQPTFQGFVSDDQTSIIASNSIAKWDTNTGNDRLPNSELMYQSLMSKGNDPSKLQHIIRAPVENKGSLQMMTRAVQAKYGKNAKLAQQYSFKPADNNFKDLVGDYWTAINGLSNVRPSSFMAADHPVALDNLQVTEIIVWPQVPSTSIQGAMIIMMGRQ